MDRIYKNIKTGGYTDEFGESVEIEEVFRNSDLFAFSGDKHPLIIAQWNRVIAAWFVLSEYELTSPNMSDKMSDKSTYIRQPVTKKLSL